MKMIVGLGNPGKEYENTRHNVGFMVLDNWMNKHNFTFDKNKLNGLYSIIKYNNEDVLVLKPLSFMNLSGTVIRAFMNYYKIDVNDLLVIYDDKDIALGSVKLKKNGSSAGHNGIKNIIENLKTENFKRLKVGLSKNNVDMVSFVLGKFNNDEMCKLNVVLNETNDILDDYFVMTFDNLMNKYNKKG
ncbi:MAG: aminoacyl-tRNA hydrolase [Firmicutes bacterium]|nr:aminoacyl-tRNA hydrolase [Bacillota bacterium]